MFKVTPMRRLTSLVSCALVAILALFLLPGTALERAIFSLTARSFANPPFFISGEGKHSRPYVLRTLSGQTTGTPEHRPPDIIITDDPENVFQSSPPSPVDFAIILKNIQRVGASSVAISTPLAWQETDAISLAALDQQLDSFASLVTAAPLSRNPVPSSMPAAFRRGSFPIAKIHGNTSALPIVNRVSIPGAILGSRTSLAAFTVLESEPQTEFLPMIARWEGDDRAVLSFHLLSVISHFQIPPESLEIHLGKYISVGKNGPHIPIDRFGRLTLPPPSASRIPAIPASNLIDAPDDLLAPNTFRPAVIRSALSAADPTSTNYSELLIEIIATLSDPTSTSQLQIYKKLPYHVELLILASLLSLLYGSGNYLSLSGKLPLSLLAALLLALHFIMVSKSHIWIPTIPALLAISTYALLNFRIHKDIQHKQAKPQTIPPLPPEKPEPAKSPPAKKAPRKSPANKTAKKAAEKTSRKVAKKAVRKAARKAAKKTARKSPAKKTPPKPSGE